MSEPQKKPARTRAERAALLLEQERKLRDKRIKLEQKIRGQEAAAKRKADTRRKILVGAWFLDDLKDKDGAPVKGRVDYLVGVIERRALNERDREAIAPLYRELTGRDLPPPPAPAAPVAPSSPFPAPASQAVQIPEIREATGS